MIQVFGIRPAWGLPCVSPYVTKLVYWLRWQQVPHTLLSQDASRLREDSPSGKLPYAILTDGQRMADSSALMAHLGGRDEAGLTERQRAQSLAFMRMIDEHLVWHAVVEPRWSVDANWQRYRQDLFGISEPWPDSLVELSDAIRQHIINQWRDCGLGVLPEGQRHARARSDIKALADQVGDGSFLLGTQPCRADAALASLVDQVMCSPFESVVKEAIADNPSLMRLSEHWAAMAQAR